MTSSAEHTCTHRIRMSGIVQGVGFRPTVWRLATEEGLSGHVLNDACGVEIEVSGPLPAIERFVERLRSEPPPLARIDHVAIEAVTLVGSPDGFRIVDSRGGPITTGIVADAATCPACLAEVVDPADRRHGYAFTNCTHCGPRLSIVRAIPYDRGNTAMDVFAMCAKCRREYDDPADRRFHAEPNACPVCGPRLWLEAADGALLEGDAITLAAGRLAEAGLLALKGLGGFHLACDAANEIAVRNLRQRKGRPTKPLALMVADLAMAETIAHVGEQERTLLSSPVAPIVLLRRRDGARLAEAVAPGQTRIGVMLAYTPLHHLLLRAVGRPLVMTSGNRSEEPQAINNAEARARLASIADAFLMHDRDILNRLDDSVVRNDAHGPSILRRARGLAPASIRMPEVFLGAPPVLAIGGDLKSAFCLLRDGAATLSQHMGDLSDACTFDEFEQALDLYSRLFGFRPARIAVDQHPGYLSTRLGRAIAERLGLALVPVQHHHAHLAAVLAENGHAPDGGNVLGIVMDGTGLGSDGTIWGGEMLLGGYRGFERVGHFEPVPLIGGDRAAREPWRNALAYLRAAYAMDEIAELARRPDLAWIGTKPLNTIEHMIERGFNTPLTSSAGRLFDAVAALAGVCRERLSFEGEAGLALEVLAEPFMGVEPADCGYPVAIGLGDPIVLSFRPMFASIVADLGTGVPAGVIAARFHAGLIAALAEAAGRIARNRGVGTVALSGGVFQNRLLLDGLGAALGAHGLRVLRHTEVPANDGGLSIGQAAIAALRP